ncbi:hypothetical protein [Chloracidobacterium thermophilum]|uniref:hypothetical protein n=1 Tax=Chloracidobacterium thermophilum TaxID=458033 RepID=UPI0007389B46|nr:hypothetical protein [Chloracidobacterium thermophilum]
MARFTETDEAAQLLQQILSMSTAARPTYPGSAPEAPADWDEHATADAQSVDEAMTLRFIPEPTPVPPPLPAASETVIRELVTTHAGQVQLTLRTSAQTLPGSSDAETVAAFFRRVVRPLPNANLSAM